MFFIFLFGAVIGSFLNVCIYRIPRGESIMFPPSHCTNCLKKISPLNLIPIMSYIFLKGKSSCCSSRISLRYPAIELLTGFMFVIIYLSYGLGFLFLKWIFFLCVITVIAFIDMDTNDVYFSSITFGVMGALIFAAIQFENFNISTWGCLDYIFGGITGLALIGAIIILTKGMGAGDAEICFMAGMFLGFEKTVLMIFISFIAGGMAGVYLMASRKKGAKEYMPFAPVIAFASIITIIFGSKILSWYMRGF